MITESFTVNKRNMKISEREKVKIKAREKNKLNWDDKLTLEFNGDAPRITSLPLNVQIKCLPFFFAATPPWLDYDNEPLPLGDKCFHGGSPIVAIANYAESGESVNTFIGAGRLKKPDTDEEGRLSLYGVRTQRSETERTRQRSFLFFMYNPEDLY